MKFRPLKPLAPATAKRISDADLNRLIETLSGGSVLCLSGAGISTESGLRDYRSPGVAAARKRPPIQHHEFVSSEKVRQRYWARSYVGYPLLSQTQPNKSHIALANLHNASGLFSAHITQNVDGLLQRAGLDTSRGFLELHGTIHHVTCLSCGHVETRKDFQEQLRNVNPGWLDLLSTYEYRADGDAELDNSVVQHFRVPKCSSCGAQKTMPKLVFMGGNLPTSDRQRAQELVQDCGAVLVCGSTTTTYSAYSLVKKAKEAGRPVAIVNHGETRSDGLADCRVDGLLSDTMVRLAQHWCPEALSADLTDTSEYMARTPLPT